MYQYTPGYYTTVRRIPQEIRNRIFSTFCKMDYVNTAFVVERQRKDVPWRLRWKQDGRVRGIALGMDERVANAVRIVVSKRYLNELCTVLTEHTRQREEERKEQYRANAYERKLRQEERRLWNEIRQANPDLYFNVHARRPAR